MQSQSPTPPFSLCFSEFLLWPGPGRSSTAKSRQGNSEQHQAQHEQAKPQQQHTQRVLSEMLSVQVHPGDAHANLLPAGETAKTEAWVVLEAGTESHIYVGLKPHTNCRGSAAGTHKQDGGKSTRMVHPEVRRRRLSLGLDSSLSARKRRSIRGSAEQRRDVSLVRLGPSRREDRPAAGALSRPGACPH